MPSRVVNTATEDFEKTVLDFTGGRGVDFAIDSYGATMLDRTFGVTRMMGHVISHRRGRGPALQEPPRAHPAALADFHAAASGPCRPELARRDAGVAHCLEGLAEGWLKVPIEGVFPLAQAAEMHRRLEGRHVAGKLLP